MSTRAMASFISASQVPASRASARQLVLALAAALSLAAVAPAALADDDGWKRAKWGDDDRREYRDGRHYRDDRRYRDDRHYRGAEYDYARVVDVHPLVRQVRVEVPTRECYDETYYEERGGPRRQGAAGSMVLGGLIGGAIGSQIGSGDGRRAATVAGALIGTALGHDAADRRRDRYYEPVRRPVTVERCDTRYETRYDERIEGYDVTYEYHGRTFRTRLPYDPGRQMRVRVDVAPAER